MQHSHRGGCHHSVICLASSPRVYNIIEDTPSTLEAVVKVYSGYGSGYKHGNLSNISISNVVSNGAQYAVMVKADVKDVAFTNIRQLKKNGQSHFFEGESDNLSISNIR